MNIKIELGDFFEDYRKETLLFIDIEEKRLVCDVIQYICEVCEIEDRQESNETICLFANEIFIPNKQPSLVLKEVKDVLSLKRQLNVGKISKISGKSNCGINEGDKSGNKKFTYSVNAFSSNNLDVINNVTPFTEKTLNNGITYSNLPKERRKRDRKNISDNPKLLLDNGDSNVSTTNPECHYVSDINKAVKHIINELSPKTVSLEFTNPCNAPLDNNSDLPEYLYDQNATKSLSKKKKSRKKEKSSSKELFESNSTTSVISTGIDNICYSNNTENICSNKEKECLLTPSVFSSTSSVGMNNCNRKHDKSQIDIEKNEIVQGKFQNTENLHDYEDCNISSINLINTQKRKRKRKHNKKSHVMIGKEFGTQSNPVLANDYFKQKCKLLKKDDDSGKKNKHIKFGSDDEEENKLENDSTSKICSPIPAELQNVIFLTSNICNQVSSKYTNSSLCSNIVDSSSAIVEVHPVTPFTFQNSGKDPPSSQHTEGLIDSITFANLLKLENSKVVSIFKRENSKSYLSSQNIESNNRFMQEPFNVINSAVPRSPPSPKIVSTKLSKDVGSELNHYEEMEKSVYPHVYYRKKKFHHGTVDNETVSYSREVAINNVSKDSFLELPSSFTSGNSKSERKNLPILNACFATEELVGPSSSETNGLNNVTTNMDGISFMGAKPKKFKEKKIYSPLGMIIESLRNSKQNVIVKEENVTNAIDHLNPYHKEIDTVIVDHLEHNFNDLPKCKGYNEEKVKVENDCANPEICNNMVDKTESEASLLDCQSIVDLSLSSDLANVKENNNLNYFYKSCPVLPNLPNEGDIIAAKVMTLDDTFSPCFSDYRSAKVISISGLKLSLLFLDQNEFTLDELQKDKVDSIGNNGKISNIDWRDLKDIRLVFP